MNHPTQRSPLERLALATDGLDPHVTEAIMSIAGELARQIIAVEALADAQAVELREYRRREAELTRREEDVRTAVDALNRLAQPDARVRLRGEEAMEWRHGLPEGGVR